MFEVLGAKIHRYRWLTLALAGAFLVASLVVLFRGGDLTGGTIHGIESERAQQIAASRNRGGQGCREARLPLRGYPGDTVVTWQAHRVFLTAPAMQD